MADPVPPASDFRFLADQLNRLEQRIRDLQAADGQQQAQSLKLLTEQVAELQTVVNLLLALQQLQYAEFTSIVTGFTGFQASVSVSLTCQTGRLRLEYGGSLNGGEGFFVYRITGASSGLIVSETTVQANPARRVAVTGGASFTPSGNKTTVLNVPSNEVLTVQLYLNTQQTNTTFVGGSILAQVAP